MRVLLLFFLLFPLISFSQLNFSDDFSDGNFDQSPVWSGDTGKFIVNANLNLQLLDTVAGTAYLSSPSAIAEEATWEFYLEMDFNPSGNNFGRFYLMSDQPNLLGPLNGYFVRIGGSSDDRISLYRQSGTNEDLIIETTDDWVDTNPVTARVQVRRTGAGFWRLAVDTGGGSNFVAIDSASDNIHGLSTHLGVVCEYTKTRADRFFWDDISASGRAFVDSVAPRLDSLEIVNVNTLRLTFNEALEPASAENENNYVVNQGIGTPGLATLNPLDQRQVELNFTNLFANKTLYTLTISGVEDQFGNDSTQSRDFSYLVAEAGDVVINELMPDPNPVVGVPPNALPEREYLELYNRTALPIDLADWNLIAGSSNEILPSYILAPDSFVVITKDDGVSEFPAALPILGLDMSSVALTNGGTTVSLLSPQGTVISTVSYTDEWYNDPNRSDGGWSIEQIDADNLCGGIDNWRASVDPSGGTPGRRNSVAGVNPDTTAPQLLRAALTGDSTVLIVFSERIAAGPLADPLNYRIDPPLTIAAVEIPLAGDQAILELAEPVAPEVIYRLWLDSVLLDCSGNVLERDTLRFGIPAEPEAGDILFNELLFNPPSGGSDFVELRNMSDKVFDLSRLQLGNVEAGLPVDLELISEESFLFYPGDYLALTEDRAFLNSNYDLQVPEQVIEINDLPSMSDDEGSIVLVTLGLNEIDRLLYDEDWHLATLEEVDGISLERLSTDRPTQEAQNWTSAAALAGYATPGYENSQRFRPEFSSSLSPDPKVFSPNQDGYNDQTRIAFRFPDPNNVVNLRVYSAGGTLLRELVRNENVAQEGYFVWDGTDENGNLLARGVYILLMEYYQLDGGKTEVLKETVILSR